MDQIRMVFDIIWYYEFVFQKSTIFDENIKFYEEVKFDKNVKFDKLFNNLIDLSTIFVLFGFFKAY